MNEEEIFHQALARGDPAERTAYLEQACAGNTALRASVEALLRANVGASAFMKGPAQALLTTDEKPAVERPGAVIGPYKLLQQIGEGGMGVVFMAEQTHPVQRKVALKVIKAGMDSRQVIARFEAERQALAMMDHVNIARVLDAGMTGGEPGGVSPGRPYFVMELVHGVPITKYCDDNHLTPRERLELFVPVCQAIQHAHQKGIIHRDIKPSNVMITLYDGKPVPKVIDFGVAKATEQRLTERTLFTQYGTMIGTFEYMSPEQAEMSALGADTRSDIYSLGVLLYELLTGSTPLTHKRLKDAAFVEVLRMIKEEEPPKPSRRLSDSGAALASISAQRHMEPAKLTKLVRGELDWIVMKCLEKDRNRRYETANAFAADVQRYLNDEPVQACPPTAAYRFRKFARRNKGALAIASTAVLVVLLGFVGLAASHLLVTREKERVLREKERGDQHLARAKKVMEDYLANTAADRRLKAAGLHDLRKSLLTSMVSFLEELAGQEEEDAALRISRGWAYLQLAHIWAEIGESDKAITHYDLARASWAGLAVDFPAVPSHREHLAECANNRGVLLKDLDRLDEAERSHRQALAIREQLAAEFPAVAAHRSGMGGTLHNLAFLERRRGNREGERRLLEQAIIHQNAAIQIDPRNREARAFLASHHGNLGVVLMELGRGAESAAAHGEARAVFDGLLADFPTDPEFHYSAARCYINLGNLYGAGRPVEAVKAYREAVIFLDKLAAEFPAVPDYRESLAGVHHNLGHELAKLGKDEEAGTAFDTTLSLHEQLVKQHPGAAGYTLALGIGLIRRGAREADAGRFGAALLPLTRAVDILEPLAAPERNVDGAAVELGNAHGAKADVLLRLGRHAEALKDYDHALALDDGKNRLYLRIQRAMTLAHLKEHVQAAAAAAAVAGGKGLPADLLQDAAGVHAVCSAASRDNAELSEQYAVKAVALLRQAFERNYKAIAKDVQSDKNLNALRSRTDFQKLVSEWEAKQEK